MIKNIVFDVGMVLVDFRWREYMYDLGISKEHVDFLGRNIISSSYWDEMDLGVRDDICACGFFCNLYPEYAEEIKRVWENMADIVREYDYSEKMVEELKKKGFNVYLLSNYPPNMSKLHWPHFKFRKKVDGEVISGIEKVAKPDPAIYKLLCDRYGLVPGECIFVDDREKNVKAAKLFGMQGYVWIPVSKENPAGDASKNLKKMLAIDLPL